MFPPVYQTADVCTHLMIGNGFDSAAGTQVYPPRSLNLHGGFFELLFEIFPGFKVVFDQLEYCTLGTIGGFRSPKLREELIV